MPIHDDLAQLLDSQLEFLQSLHAEGDLAPLAASMDLEGEVRGQALTVAPGHENPPIAFALNYFAERFRAAFKDGRIRAAAVFFHGNTAGGSTRPALTREEANSLVAWLEHASGQSVQAVIGYSMEEVLPGAGSWKYAGPVFTEKPSTLGCR